MGACIISGRSKRREPEGDCLSGFLATYLAPRWRQPMEGAMTKATFTTARLVLSGALLGVAAANAFFGVEHLGEVLGGVAGAGVALAAMKLSAII